MRIPSRSRSSPNRPRGTPRVSASRLFAINSSPALHHLFGQALRAGTCRSWQRRRVTTQRLDQFARSGSMRAQSLAGHRRSTGAAAMTLRPAAGAHAAQPRSARLHTLIPLSCERVQNVAPVIARCSPPNPVHCGTCRTDGRGSWALPHRTRLQFGGSRCATGASLVWAASPQLEVVFDLSAEGHRLRSWQVIIGSRWVNRKRRSPVNRRGVGKPGSRRLQQLHTRHMPVASSKGTPPQIEVPPLRP